MSVTIRYSLKILLYFQGTFDVQNSSFSIQNGQICFHCIFATGSFNSGCYIEYKDSNNTVLGNIIIKQPNTSNCTTIDVADNIATALVYDIEIDGRITTNEPAIELIDIIAPTMATTGTTPLIYNNPSPSITTTDKCMTCICAGRFNYLLRAIVMFTARRPAQFCQFTLYFALEIIKDIAVLEFFIQLDYSNDTIITM